jgi:plastocyanin
MTAGWPWRAPPRRTQGSTMRSDQKALVLRAVAAFLLAGAVVGLGVLSGFAKAAYVISQKGREFRPNNVTIKRGEQIEIVNDDGDLRHHAYIESDTMTFDSGDQEPGSRTAVAFATRGEFEVLCAIHPKMRLVVRVQ